MAIQSALVNVKMFLSQERKIDPEKLSALVDEAYQLVMKKIDSLEQPFIYKFERSYKILVISKVFGRQGVNQI